MVERPILFSSPMVRALLAGRKTVTRRLVDPLMFIETTNPDRIVEQSSPDFGQAATEWARSPYGQAGDRLWVRETLKRDAHRRWHYAADGVPVQLPEGHPSVGAMLSWAHHKEGATCVSIHMPRWASRLALEVVSVRVERLHDITEEDARAEGVTRHAQKPHQWQGFDGGTYGTARGAFSSLWSAINGGESWDANPWVWVVSFMRVEVKRGE